MSRAGFKLPNIHELNKPQRNALDLPPEGQHLIIGGPGTGKSVVALLRARRLANENRKYVFLVYNILLERSCRMLGGGGLNTYTWQKWFDNEFYKWYKCKIPGINSESGDSNDWNDINWAAIRKMEPVPPAEELPYLVIDEGQDMPPEFYETLITVGFENFYVAADQNQRITAHNSSRRQIEQALCIAPENTLLLTVNYRNTLPIARLAAQFHTNDPASARIELPAPRDIDKLPCLVTLNNCPTERIAAHILKEYDRNIDKLICIITPTNIIREAFCEALRNAVLRMQLDHKDLRIQTYFSGCDEGINFHNGGIAVINQQSVKGLEFDSVYIADIDNYYSRDTDDLKKKFYVMVSRARDSVTLLRTSVTGRRIDAILPADETILERRVYNGA